MAEVVAPTPVAAPSPTKPVTPTTPATPSPAEQLAKLQSERDAFEKQRRLHAIDVRKAGEEKKGLGAKLTELGELQKWKANQERLDKTAALNKSAFLESKFGPKWYDEIVEERVNGGAPPAALVATSIEALREEFQAKLDAKDKELEQRTATAKQADEQRVEQEWRGDMANFAKSKLDEYPVLKAVGDERVIGSLVADKIKSEFERTQKMLSPQEALDSVEAQALAIVDAAAGAEKYKSRLTEKLKPATVPASSLNGLRRTEQPAERRTLSNDLTASTPGRVPPRNDDERRARAIAAAEAATRR